MNNKYEYERTINQVKSIIDKIGELKNSITVLENTEKNNISFEDNIPSNESFDDIKEQIRLLHTSLVTEFTELKEEYENSLMNESWINN